jgi:hypothetical protein
MNTSSYQKVFSVNGILRAIAIQDALEQTGIPVQIVASRNSTYLDVTVPSERMAEAQSLLSPERRCGEIFYVPAQF